MAQQRLKIVPMTIKRAAVVVERWHRHLPKIVGGLFSVGVVDEGGEIVGVAIVGRPVGRRIDDGFTCEVARVATDGTPNACSALYGACARAAKAMGYVKVVTYTLSHEPGTSLRAAGWTEDGTSPGRAWAVPSRGRAPGNTDGITKTRWFRRLRDDSPFPHPGFHRGQEDGEAKTNQCALFMDSTGIV